MSENTNQIGSTQIHDKTMKSLIDVLTQIPDIDDMIIRDKKLCSKTNSGDYALIDLSNLPIPTNMTIADFGLKSKVLKVLTNDWSKDMTYEETDKAISYTIGNQVYYSIIPIINNPFSMDTYEGILSDAAILFEIDLTVHTFQKIKSVIELYKAFPELISNSEGDGENTLAVNITSSSKTDKFVLDIHDVDSFAANGIELKEPLRLSRPLFLYPFDASGVLPLEEGVEHSQEAIDAYKLAVEEAGIIKMSFYKQEHKIIIKTTGTIRGSEVSYLFETSIEQSIDDLIDINGIDLDLGLGS